jgi:hypothetical protein
MDGIYLGYDPYQFAPVIGRWVTYCCEINLRPIATSEDVREILDNWAQYEEAFAEDPVNIDVIRFSVFESFTDGVIYHANSDDIYKYRSHLDETRLKELTHINAHH